MGGQFVPDHALASPGHGCGRDGLVSRRFWLHVLYAVGMMGYLGICYVVVEATKR